MYAENDRLTRRRALWLGGATVALSGAGPVALAFGRPSALVDFAIPAGGCDCHVHVVADPGRFPMAANRVYTPPSASPAALRELQHRLHLDRVVIVQPSFYGTDNAAILEGMRQLGPRRARGVAVVGDTASDASLDALHAAGIRGIRINLETAGQTDPAPAAAKLRQATAQCVPRGWHIQLYTRPSMIAALESEMAASPVPLVFDHFGGAQAAAGTGQAGFDAISRLVRSGRAYVKISAAYRASQSTPHYDDVRPLARALVDANPDRILWGSDWPHTDSTRLPGRAPTDVTPFLAIDDVAMLNQLPRWIPDRAIRNRILVDNPARLYDF